MPGILALNKDNAAAMLELDKVDIGDVAAILDGDEEAYARLVEKHGQAVQKQMRNFSLVSVDSSKLLNQHR